MAATWLLVALVPFGNSVFAQAPNPTPSSPGSGVSAAVNAIAPVAEAIRSNGYTEVAGREAHMMLVIMTILYLIQIFFSVTKASKEPDGIPEASKESAGKALTILSCTFWGQKRLIRAWVSVATIMLFPTLLSWFLGFFHDNIPPANFGNVVAYRASVALLTTLVTVELTLLLDLRGEGKNWNAMLVIALALDVLSLFIFAAFIGGFVGDSTWGTQDSYETLLIAVIGTAACVSSFLIILFAKVANDYPFEASEGRAPRGAASHGL